MRARVPGGCCTFHLISRCPAPSSAPPPPGLLRRWYAYASTAPLEGEGRSLTEEGGAEGSAMLAGDRLTGSL